MKFQLHGSSVRWLLWQLVDRVLQRVHGKSAAKPYTINDLMGALVLRGSRGKSAGFSRRINHLDRLLVLRGHQQDSTEMAEEIGAGDAECFLGEIPRQLRQRRREHQWEDRALGLLGLGPAALHTMCDEVVGITTTPRSLRSRAPRHLTRRRRTRTLAATDAPVGDKPATADATGTLREHLQMLASSAGTQGGPLLASIMVRPASC